MAIGASAHAQVAASPSRVAPQSAAPVHAQPDGSVDLPETAPASAPPGAESLMIKVGGVVIEGLDHTMPPGAIKVAAAEREALAGRSVSVAELYAAAGRIEAAFSRAGLVLTRVTLPPQHLADGGAVHFLIVDGFVESVDVSALPGSVRGVVKHRLAGLVGRRGLTLAQIERHVLLAGDVPGVQLRSALVHGDAPGATRLVVSGAYQPVSGSLAADNNLGSAYQFEAFTAQIALNSLIGLGEQIYATVANGPDFDHLFDAKPRRRVAAVGVIVPIGNDGLTVNPEWTRVDTAPRNPNGAALTTGLFERAALRVSWPVIRSRRENLTVSGSWNLSSEISDVVGLGTLSHDRLRYGTLGLAWMRSLGKASVASVDGDVSIGVSGLGARTAADAVASGIALSRQGASPDFKKADVTARLASRIGSGFEATAIVRAQASFTGALPAAAEFSLDGSDALSSFALGSVNVDSGVTGRLELARPIALVALKGAALTPYVFGAAGYGHVSQATALEVADVNSWAAGGGLRLVLAPGIGRVLTTAAVEVSHGHYTAAPGSALANDPTRVTANLTFRF